MEGRGQGRGKRPTRLRQGFGVAGAHLSRRSESEGGTPKSNVAAEGRGQRSVDEWQKSPASAALIRAILVTEFAHEKIFFCADASDDQAAHRRR